MIDTKTLTIKEAHDFLTGNVFTAADLCAACVAVIDAENKELNAVLEVFADWREQAAEADAMLKAGKGTMLTGIPIILKDNILFEGHHVSAGSKILEPYRATYSCLAVKNLCAQGAIILGRANMDEFAMGSSTENSAFGVTKNPHDKMRVAGGSSGGSAAAIASGMCLAALGSDTGGSVRQPAGFCGVVGMKPSYDYATRHGVIAMGNSLDQVGPLAKTAADVALVCEAISAYDPNDSTSVPEELRKKYEAENLPASLGGSGIGGTAVKTIGVPWSEVEREGIDPEVLTNFKNSIEKLKNVGYSIQDISLPTMKYSLAAYYIIMPAEVSTNLSRLDGIRYGLSVPADSLYDVYAKTRAQGFGPETRRRIMLGTYVLSHGYYDAYYRKALLVRDAIKKEFNDMFKTVDVIATPTSPTPAFKIGEKSQDPLAMYLSDIFTVPANITGNPAISIPNGKHSSGLPLDIHFAFAYGADKKLFEFAEAFEQVRG